MDHDKKENLSTKGLTLGSFLNLTEEQRQLVNWMRHQQSCSLRELKTEIGENNLEKILEELLNLGIVEELQNGDNPTYKVTIAPRKKNLHFQQLTEKLNKKINNN
jgi:predicted transcriptional regulator